MQLLHHHPLACNCAQHHDQGSHIHLLYAPLQHDGNHAVGTLGHTLLGHEHSRWAMCPFANLVCALHLLPLGAANCWRLLPHASCCCCLLLQLLAAPWAHVYVLGCDHDCALWTMLPLTSFPIVPLCPLCPLVPSAHCPLCPLVPIVLGPHLDPWKAWPCCKAAARSQAPPCLVPPFCLC